MNDWSPKQRAPASTAALYRWIADHSRATDIAAARLQRRISFMAVAGALDRVRDEHDRHRFVIKGGVAMELRHPDRARTTRDLDAAYRGLDQDIHALLNQAFASPFSDFSFEIGRTPYEHPDIDLVIVDVRDLVPAFAIDEYGLDGPSHVACLPLSAQLAQKLHACTVGFGADDRARDLIDILFIRGMLEPSELPQVRALCIRVFDERAIGEWPPIIELRETWRPLLASALEDLDFPLTRLEEVVGEVAAFITEIEAAT